MDFYRGRRILVTGGTGSIGSQIVRQLLAAGPRVLRILSRDETKQMYLQEELARGRSVDNVRFLIGDVRDPARLRRSMEGIEIVFHAAAMKHVPACEYNPFEAVQTNVLGTQNVISAAREAGVGRVVAVSTDKATLPENTMGATKLLAERLIAAAHISSPGQVLCAVRFGNVLGSRGSLVPLVQQRLEAGQPIALTHPAMTRFMMTTEDAVRLVLEAGARANGGEIFILRMPSLRVKDLIEVLVAEYAARVERPIEEFPVHVTGIRAGEKLHEVLLTEDEARRTRRDGDLFILEPRGLEPSGLETRAIDVAPADRGEASKAGGVRSYESNTAELLTKGGIRSLLARAGVLPARQSVPEAALA